MALNVSSLMRPTAKTLYGQTETQAALPSQRRASTAGRKEPGSGPQAASVAVDVMNRFSLFCEFTAIVG